MTDLQFYLTFVLGFILAWATLFLGGIKIKKGFIKLSLVLLALKAALNIFSFIVHLIDGKWLAGFLYSAYYVPNLFLSGAIVALFLFRSFLPAKRKNMDTLTSPYIDTFDKLCKVFISSTFITASLSSFFHFNASAAGFLTLGYGTGFMIFIKLLEGFCAVGVLFRKTAFYASLLLSIEMLGATYTHYYNYFARQMPDPFSNSVPSLILQPFLLAITILAFQRMKKPLSSIPTENIPVSE